LRPPAAAAHAAGRSRRVRDGPARGRGTGRDRTAPGRLRGGVPRERHAGAGREALSDGGRHLAGAGVYRYVMRRLWWAYPLYLLTVTPGRRRVFDRGDRLFADRRLGVSAACGLRPPGAAVIHPAPGTSTGTR